MNAAFQQSILAVVEQHGISAHLDPRDQDGDAYAHEDESFIRTVRCIFPNGEFGSVEIQTAPVKTLARMREKLVE